MVVACCGWGINNFLTDHKTMQNRENLAEFKIYVLSSTSCTNRPPEIQHTNDQPDINSTPNPSLLCKRCQSRPAWRPGDQPRRPPRCCQAEGQRMLNDVVGPCCGHTWRWHSHTVGDFAHINFRVCLRLKPICLQFMPNYSFWEFPTGSARNSNKRVTNGAESRRGIFSPAPGFFFLICSVFRPLHLSCHFPSMLHAICSILELEPFILRVILAFWSWTVHAACYLQHFGAGTFYFACYLPHLGAGTVYLSCYLPHLRAGTFQFACYL